MRCRRADGFPSPATLTRAQAHSDRRSADATDGRPRGRWSLDAVPHSDAHVDRRRWQRSGAGAGGVGLRVDCQLRGEAPAALARAAPRSILDRELQRGRPQQLQRPRREQPPACAPDRRRRRWPGGRRYAGRLAADDTQLGLAASPDRRTATRTVPASASRAAAPSMTAAGIAGRVRIRDDDVESVGGQLVADARQASDERRATRSWAATRSPSRQRGAVSADAPDPLEHEQHEDRCRPARAAEQPPRR